MKLKINPSRKSTPGKAERTVVDCSKIKPVAGPDTIETFGKIFNNDQNVSELAIAELATLLANDQQVDRIIKIGERHQALAEWLCCMTNNLLSTDTSTNKTKIPELSESEIMKIMRQNDECMVDFEDSATIINLASLSIFSYLADRKQQPRAMLNDYVCETNFEVEMAA